MKYIRSEGRQDKIQTYAWNSCQRKETQRILDEPTSQERKETQHDLIHDVFVLNQAKQNKSRGSNGKPGQTYNPTAIAIRKRPEKWPEDAWSGNC